MAALTPSGAMRCRMPAVAGRLRTVKLVVMFSFHNPEDLLPKLLRFSGILKLCPIFEKNKCANQPVAFNFVRRSPKVCSGVLVLLKSTGHENQFAAIKMFCACISVAFHLPSMTSVSTTRCFWAVYGPSRRRKLSAILLAEHDRSMCKDSRRKRFDVSRAGCFRCT